MSVLNNGLGLLLASEAGGGGGYTIDRSVRLNSADSTSLTRTPSTESNRKTWTFSFWVKRSNLSAGAIQNILNCETTPIDGFFFDTNDTLKYRSFDGGSEVIQLVTTQVFRDVSAWYHIVVSVDTTQATSSNRVRFYVNGAQVTSFSTAIYGSQNYNTGINAGGVRHVIGAYANSAYLNGYLADINFVDGQALTPSSFGETDTNGVWQPKDYTGTYGTNGYHLTFSNNATSATLGTDSSGNNNTWTVNNISATTGGPTSVAAASGALPIYNTTDTYGTTKGSGTRTDSNSSSIVLALPMDGSNGGTTFTEESATIKGSGSAKTINRFGNSQTSTALSKYYGSSGLFDGSGDYLTVSATADLQFGAGDFCIEFWWYPTSTARQALYHGSVGTDWSIGIDYNSMGAPTMGIWASSSGTSWNMINADAGGNGIGTITIRQNQWHHIAYTRSGNTFRLFVNGIQDIAVSNSGTIIDRSGSAAAIGAWWSLSMQQVTGNLQDFRIYKGIAKYTSNFNPPSSTQNPAIAAGNDSLVDSPTNGSQTDTGVGGQVVGNYCTLNPLDAGNVTLTNGNLNVSASGDQNVRGTIAFPSTGKWYFESYAVGGTSYAVGIADRTTPITTDPTSGYNVLYQDNGLKIVNGSASAYGATFGANVIGIAYDADNNQITFYKDNVSQGVINVTSGITYFPFSKHYNASVAFNFGQRPFAYTAPSGFKALCTANLPTPTITKGNTVMDAILYTGTGTTNAISSLAFSPDFVWIKSRSTSQDPNLFDIVRGPSSDLYALQSNAGSAEGQYGTMGSLDSNGFTLTGAGGATNANGTTYVAWCWEGGTSTVTNNSGTIASQVRANASAGISIVAYSGNTNVNATVGHGLNVNPGLILLKGRNNTFYWRVYHSYFGTNATQGLYLNDPSGAANHDNYGGIKAITSSTFGFGTNGTNDLDAVNKTGINYVAYCFAPVAGFSAMGSYTGSTAPNYINIGFTPGLIVIKRTDTGTESWLMTTKKTGPNVIGAYLAANSGTQEQTVTYLDIVSNGFVHRNNTGWNNAPGGNYVYFAFAENPFKIARAV